MKAIFFNDFSTSFIPHILKEIYIEKLYRPYFDGRKDLMILDVGANIGLFSQYAYPYAKRIYAIEPAKQHIEVLEHMIKFNKIDDRITPIKKALAGKNGTATFYHNSNTTMFSLRPEVNQLPKESETVETITFDALLKDLKLDHVDFVKLDVEGAEMDIICGDGFSKAADKIDMVCGENHAWNNTNPHQLQAAFEDNGFKFKWIPADAQVFIAWKDK